MPYIEKESRNYVDPIIEELIEEEPDAGELTYIFYRLLLNYYKSHGGRYAVASQVMGILDCTGKEFYQRKILPYEIQQRIKNGDVS